MKKTALMLAVAAGALSLAGCGQKAEEAAAPASEAAAETASDAASDAAPAAAESGDATAAEAKEEGDDGKGNDVKK